MNRVDGKVALVTGAGAGIGRASCELLAKAGAKVVVTDIDLPTAEETAKIILSSGGEAIAVQLDVASEDDWQKALDTTIKHFKKINILVNNAAIEIGVRCEETSLAMWQKVNSVNYDGIFLGIRIAIKTMKENEGANSIINISSVGGLVPYQDASYCAGKAGMGMLAKCAALECRKKCYDIRVNTIYPGSIKGAMGKEIKETEEYQQRFLDHYPVDRVGEVNDIANGVLFLASDDSSYMTGTDFVIDGGIMLNGIDDKMG